MTARCFHCHEPVPERVEIRVDIGGSERAMCCHGCAAVARLITGSGLGQFYQFREAPARRPDDIAADWTIYDRPALLAAVGEPLGGQRREFLLGLSGVTCGACGWLIESALLEHPGLEGLSVDPVTGRARVTLDLSRTRLSEVLAALDRLGYRPQPLSEELRLREDRAERRRALRRLAVAGFGMMQVMTYAVALYAGYFQDMDTATRDFLRLISLVVTTPVLLYAGWPFLAGGWRGIRHRRPGMDVPIALALVIAWSASAWNTFTGGTEVYFDSVAMFVFLLSIARWVEMRLRHRAAAIGSTVGETLPAHAHRRADGGWETVALAELEPGDVVRIAQGETIPADGRLLTGEARVDESLLTGESRPIARRTGDNVIAGSLLLEGPAEIRITRTGRDTVLSALRRMLERARCQRPEAVSAADRLARHLVVFVLLLSAGTGAFWWAVDPDRAFDAALAVLVITCPCALSLATPTVLAAASAALARRGVLVVDSGALERLARADRVVFDKTGTLTTGRLTVRQVATCGALSAERAQQVAAALEAGGTHPIARALAGAVPTEAHGLQHHPGRGVEGHVGSTRYRLGRLEWVRELAPGTQPTASVDGIWLGSAAGLLARFDLEESLREDAAAAVAALPLPATILSGDAQAPVLAAARQLAIDSTYWRQLPADKLAYVQARQAAGETVAMVGDGSNDAPVLAQADVAIAVGSGSALASRQGDVIIMRPALLPVVDVFRTAQRVRRIIRQNLTWALAYNLTAVPLAAAGLVPPWLAAIGMSCSSLLVVLNSLRARRTTEPPGVSAGAASFEARTPLPHATTP